MADFDAADGALEGFRIIRQRPQVIPAWAGLQLAAGLLLGLLGVVLGGETLTEFIRLQAQGPARPGDQERVLGLMSQVWPFFLSATFLNLLVGAVFSSAVFRAVLRPSDGGPGFLRFGADEGRVMISILAVVLLCFVASLGIGFLLGAILVLVLSPGLAVITLFLVMSMLLLFLLTRLSLAWPQTFAERRVSILRAWRLSRGRFWPLFGMVVLAAVLAVVVYILALLIYFPVGVVLSGGLRGAGEPLRPSYDSFAAWFSPAMGAYLLLVIGFGGALINAALMAPLAHAYRALSAEAPTEAPAA